MTHRIRTLAALAALTTVLAACGSGADDPAPSGAGGDGAQPADVTMVIASAVTGPKEEVAVFAVAKEMGYFAAEKLTVKTINADGSIAAVQAVGGGQGDITASDTGSILAGVQKGVPVKAVGGLVQNWPWRIATLPDSPAKAGGDFKGKKIGVISLASGSAPFARAFVKDAGLDPEKDVELLPVGVGAQAASALTSGKVDALALYTQAYSTIESSGTKLAYLDNPEIFQGIRSLSFAVNAGSFDKNKGVNERFLRAAYKAMLFSAANPEAAMRIGYKVFPQILAGTAEEARLPNDLASLKAWIATATPATGEPSGFKDWGAIPDGDWAKTQSYTKAAGQITGDVELSKVWDGGLLKAANDFDSAAVLKAAAEWKK